MTAWAEQHREDLENFRAFLRSLLMHGAVGTALGGVCTLVGEPQNLLIANVAGWDFVKFFRSWRRSPCRCLPAAWRPAPCWS